MRGLTFAALLFAGCARLVASPPSDFSTDHPGALDRARPGDLDSLDLGHRDHPGADLASDGPRADVPQVVDLSARDLASDSPPVDTRPPDTRPPDTRPPDTLAPDTRPPDTRPPDTRPPDTRSPDTLAPDTRPPDTRPPDTQPPPDQGFVCATEPSGFAGGKGSLADPYQICNCVQLQAIKTASSSSFRLTDEIDCSATATWNGGEGFVPVPFSGTFDGNFHLITALFINRPTVNEVGLFGKLSGDASIERVGLLKAKVTGKDFVGSLVGYVTDSGWTKKPKIRIAFSTSAEVQGGNYVGGLIGNEFGTLLRLEDSYFCGKVTGATDYTGGLVSTAYPGAPSSTTRGLIRNCYVCGTVQGPRTGAAFSYAWEIDVANSFSVASLPAGTGLCINRFGNGATTDSYYAGPAAAGGCGKHEALGATAFSATSHPVYATWSFGTTWKMGPDGLPTLIGFKLP